MVNDNSRQKSKSNYLNNKLSANNRYKDLKTKSNLFIARDEEQFLSKLHQSTINNQSLNNDNLTECPKEFGEINNVEHYKNLNEGTVIDTFRYIFDKFKKGIFVKIKNNKIELFLPFSNIYYRNEWSDKIKFPDTNSPKMIEKWLIEEFYKHTNYKFSREKDSINITEWYANNCLLRFDKTAGYISDRDTNIPNLHDMLISLCNTYNIPDMEFFMNKRDFPLLKANLTEPYNHIWDSSNKSLVSHKYSKYCPIISMSKTDEYSDILFPTYEDWARVRSKDNITFPDTSSSYSDNIFIPWENKNNIAIFRGTPTGPGISSVYDGSVLYNPRLKARILSKKYPDHLDAGITSKNNTFWNRRPRKLEGISTLQIIKEGKIISNFDSILCSKFSTEDVISTKIINNYLGEKNIKILDQEYLNVKNIKVKTILEIYNKNPDNFVLINPNSNTEIVIKDDVANYVSFENQCNYKYILNIDGHTAAQRLSLELSSNSVILKVDSPWKLWYSHMLIGFDINNVPDNIDISKIQAHYIKVDYSLNNLIETIENCRKYDAICKKITNNARVFYDIYLSSKHYMLEYMYNTLCKIKTITGNYDYNCRSALACQLKFEEKQQLNYIYPTSTIKKIDDLFKYSFSIQGLKAINWIFDKIACENPNELFKNNTKNYEKIICINKLGIIYKYNFYGLSLVLKETSLDFENKSEEHIHDSFIGTKCINDILDDAPNFTYTFGCYVIKKKYPNILNNKYSMAKANNKLNLTHKDLAKQKQTYITVNKFINGYTLSDYLQNTKDDISINFNDFLLVLIQLSLSLEIAQQKCGLVHNDLMPWNIIIKREQNYKTLNYIIENKTYQIKTKIIPYIIDFGKSSAIHDNIKYGYGVNIYKSKINKFNDLFMLLSSSINIFMDKDNYANNSSEANNIITLCNFITGTQFKKEKFNSIGDIKLFFRQYRKYSVLMFSNKLDLAEKTPINFADYILNNNLLEINVKRNKLQNTNTYVHYVNSKILIAKNLDENLIPTSEFSKLNIQQNRKKNELLLYKEIATNSENFENNYIILINFIKRIVGISRYNSNNILTRYYCAQVLMYNFISTTNKIYSLLKNYNNEDSIIKKDEIANYYNEFMTNIENITKYNLDNIDIDKEIPIDYEMHEYPNYNEYSFLNLENIQNLLKTFPLKFNNNLKYKHIISKILMFENKYIYNLNSKLNPNTYIASCEFPKDIRNKFKNKFQTILNINSIKNLENNSWSKTLYYTAAKLYSHEKLANI